MKIVDSDLLMVTIVLDSEKDEISNCKLKWCKIIRRFPTFVQNCMILWIKPVKYQNIDVTKPYAKIRNCVLDDCVLPEAMYGGNTFEESGGFGGI